MGKSLTFNQWKKLGYSIKKGEKSKIKDKDGMALFLSSQVSKTLSCNNDSVDYLSDSEFWAKANPNALYWQMVREPNRHISDETGAILAKKLH